MPVERFSESCHHDGSLLGVSGRWSVCGRSVVQLDHDEEMELMHGKYGALMRIFEAQRTINKIYTFLQQECIARIQSSRS